MTEENRDQRRAQLWRELCEKGIEIEGPQVEGLLDRMEGILSLALAKDRLWLACEAWVKAAQIAGPGDVSKGSAGLRELGALICEIVGHCDSETGAFLTHAVRE